MATHDTRHPEVKVNLTEDQLFRCTTAVRQEIGRLVAELRHAHLQLDEMLGSTNINYVPKPHFITGRYPMERHLHPGCILQAVTRSGRILLHITHRGELVATSVNGTLAIEPSASNMVYLAPKDGL